MGLLENVMAFDAAAFVQTDEFGEEIQYRPKDGVPCTLRALVLRDPPISREGSPASRAPRMVIYLRNDAEFGRTSIDTGGDMVYLPYRLGEECEEFAVGGPVTMDHGLWQVVVH